MVVQQLLSPSARRARGARRAIAARPQLMGRFECHYVVEVSDEEQPGFGGN